MPDPRKGERLILFTEQPATKRSDFQAFARSRGTSELMIPSEIAAIGNIPLLGAGKVDNVAVARLAQQQSAQKAAIRRELRRP